MFGSNLTEGGGKHSAALGGKSPMLLGLIDVNKYIFEQAHLKDVNMVLITLHNVCVQYRGMFSTMGDVMSTVGIS